MANRTKEWAAVLGFGVLGLGLLGVLFSSDFYDLEQSRARVEAFGRKDVPEPVDDPVAQPDRVVDAGRVTRRLSDAVLEVQARDQRVLVVMLDGTASERVVGLRVDPGPGARVHVYGRTLPLDVDELAQHGVGSKVLEDPDLPDSLAYATRIEMAE